jgi:uncharacterized membrane protein
MSNKKKLSSIALAATAAALFTTIPMTAAQAGENSQVHCYGVNKCKGHNDCKTSMNACKGHGSCKGKGFVAMSKHACDEIGGSIDKPKK